MSATLASLGVNFGPTWPNLDPVGLLAERWLGLVPSWTYLGATSLEADIWLENGAHGLFPCHGGIDRTMLRVQ